MSQKIKTKKAIHVLQRGSQWIVKTAGATKCAKVCNTQSEAIARGTELARNRRTELIVHREDGSIRSKDSYGKDPLPPRK